MSPLEPVGPRRLPLTLGLAAAAASALAFWRTGFHVVPTREGLWRGMSDPPGLLRIALAIVAGLALALALARRPASVKRPLLTLGLATLPLVPVATGGLAVLLAFQGASLVLVAMSALSVAIMHQLLISRPRVPVVRGIFLFAAAFLFYAALGTRLPGPAGPQGDEPHYLLMAESLLRGHDLDLADDLRERAYAPFFAGELRPHTSPASPPGKVYPVHAPGLPLLLLPAYAVGGYAGARLFVSAAAALAAMLVHRLVRETLDSGALALAAWALFALTPPLPLYAVSIYPETFAALATAAFLLLARRDTRPAVSLTAGLIAAALPWLHPKLLPLAVIGLALTLLGRGRLAPKLLAIAILAGSLAGLLAFLGRLYGRASLSAAYGPGFESDVSLAHLPWGALALFFDRQFGLFFVSPVWAMAVPGAVLLARARGSDAVRAVVLATATLAVGASFSMWWGGSCPPARFVVPALPALALALAPALRARPAVGAALGGAGLAGLAIAAEAPRALHNRADGESALLRFLAPSLDLDPSLPSFVSGGAEAVLLALTLAAVLALGWARGRRGFVAGTAAWLALTLTIRDRPLLDGRLATLGVLSAWDGDNLRARSGSLDLASLHLDLDLPDVPWALQEGDLRNSRRLDLPPGLYEVDLRGRVLDGAPGAHVVRLDLTASELPLARLYLRQGEPPPSLPVLLPAGARRLLATAVGIQGRGEVEAVSLRPRTLVPRRLRERFSWPRVAEPERYRVAQGDVRATALDASPADGDGFRLEGGEARFLVEGAPAREATIDLLRDAPRADDTLEWRDEVVRLGPSVRVAFTRPLRVGLRLGDTAVVPVRLHAYGSWIRFSGSAGGTSATESSSASPAARPSVTSTSAPPDSGK